LKNNYPKVTEGLLIASLPIVAYFLAYVFERGYCSYFNIPPIFIHISIFNVASEAITVIGTYAVLFFLFDSFVYPFFSKFDRALRWSLINTAVILFIMVGYAIVANLSIEHILMFFLPFICAILFFEFILPLITQKNIPGYVNKIKAQKKINFEDDTFMDKIALKIGPSLFLMIYIFILTSEAFYFAGGIKAKYKTVFLTSTKTPDVVYLEKGDNFLIGCKFDRNTNTLTNPLVIEPLNKNSVSFEKLGRLKPFRTRKVHKSLNRDNKKEVSSNENVTSNSGDTTPK